MKLKSLVSIAVACLGLGLVSEVNAATLDFSGVSTTPGSTVSIPGATITATEGFGTLIVGAGAAGQSDGFCFGLAGCTSDGEIVFDQTIQNLFFDVDGAQSGDSVEISAFDGLTLLGSIVATTNTTLDFSGFGQLNRLVFLDSSNSFGVGYSTFSFDVADTGVVPIPAALPLLATAFAGLGLASWRRKRASA